jgi:DNA-binding Lrp family transcriptional regulator
LEERPFATDALGIGMAESEAIERLADLLQRGLIRDVSGIFNYRALGYHGTLVALRIDIERIESAAAVISGHPGVSHNYRRDHAYSLWFTLVVPCDEDVEKRANELAARAGAGGVLVLPAERMYKVRTFFPATGSERPGSPAGSPHKSSTFPERGAPCAKPCFDEVERATIRALQEAMPLVPTPFDVLAEGVGLSTAELLDCARDLTRRHVLRRYAAVVRHAALGYSTNVMVALDVDKSNVDRAGAALAARRDVSHCVRRRPGADWPYTLYAMFHRRDAEGGDLSFDEIGETLGARGWVALPTVREFKKERVRFPI